MRVEWSERAGSDLQDVSAYVEQATGVRAAKRITRTIYEAVLSFEHSQIGDAQVESMARVNYWFRSCPT